MTTDGDQHQDNGEGDYRNMGEMRTSAWVSTGGYRQSDQKLLTNDLRCNGFMAIVIKSEGEAVRITWMLWCEDNRAEITWLREKVMLAEETDGSDADCWARVQYE